MFHSKLMPLHSDKIVFSISLFLYFFLLFLILPSLPLFSHFISLICVSKLRLKYYCYELLPPNLHIQKLVYVFNSLLSIAKSQYCVVSDSYMAFYQTYWLNKWVWVHQETKKYAWGDWAYFRSAFGYFKCGLLDSLTIWQFLKFYYFFGDNVHLFAVYIYAFYITSPQKQLK